MAFCTECGTEVSADVRFCTVCGKSMSEELAPALSMAAAPATDVPAAPTPPTYSEAPPPPPPPPPHEPWQSYAPPPSYTPPPVFNGEEKPPSGSRYSVLGTGAYFGLMILFNIPFIGWICCIVMAFAVQNQNLRNFARAKCIFLIIGVALSIIAVIAFSLMFNEMMDYVNDAGGGIFREFGNLEDLFKFVGTAG